LVQVLYRLSVFGAVVAFFVAVGFGDALVALGLADALVGEGVGVGVADSVVAVGSGVVDSGVGAALEDVGTAASELGSEPPPQALSSPAASPMAMTVRAACMVRFPPMVSALAPGQ
jgi:hypothetical protein